MINYLAFIPARGGSKGIPRKNLAQLGGKPLIQHTLDVVSSLGERVYPLISTNDEEISNYCSDQGYDMSYRRPEALAQDETLVIDAIDHALDWVESAGMGCPSAVLMLQPTSPLRTIDHVERALDIFEEKSLDSLVSVCPMKEHPNECMEVDSEGWNFLRGPEEILTRRQEYNPNFFFVDGSIYIATLDFLLEHRWFVVAGQTELFSHTEGWMPDIDEPEDLAIAEALLRSRSQ